MVAGDHGSVIPTIPTIPISCGLLEGRPEGTTASLGSPCTSEAVDNKAPMSQGPDASWGCIAKAMPNGNDPLGNQSTSSVIPIYIIYI